MEWEEEVQIENIIELALEQRENRLPSSPYLLFFYKYPKTKYLILGKTNRDTYF